MRPLLALLCVAHARALSIDCASTAPKSRLRSLFSETDDVFACPVDKAKLRAEVSAIAGVRRERRLSESGIVYPVNDGYADLVASSGRREGDGFPVEALASELQEAWRSRTQTQLFRSPFTVFLYERGWRQNFNNAGFPGIDKEYDEVSSFFRSAEGGVVVDMSCGTGLMTRRLVRGSQFSRVLALDYSENMLRETLRRAKAEGVPLEQLELARADVAELPLQNDSIDAMHAGAALHSWPRLEVGLQEIARVLKPGGRFFATTFIQGAYGRVTPRQSGGGGSFRFFEDEEELRQLLIAAGFPADGVEVRREGRGCAIIRATMVEPEPEPEPEAEA